MAVKVRHPGIDEALRSDFRAADSGAALANLLVPGASVRGFIDEAQRALMEECDFLLDASHQQTFAELFAADPVITIPQVEHPLYTQAVLTTH